MSVTCAEHFPVLVIMADVDGRSTMCFRCLEELIWHAARDSLAKLRELEWAKEQIESDDPVVWYGL